MAACCRPSPRRATRCASPRPCRHPPSEWRVASGDGGFRRPRTGADPDLGRAGTVGLGPPPDDLDLLLLPGLMHNSPHDLIERVTSMQPELELLRAMHLRGVQLAGKLQRQIPAGRVGAARRPPRHLQLVAGDGLPGTLPERAPGGGCHGDRGRRHADRGRRLLAAVDDDETDRTGGRRRACAADRAPAADRYRTAKPGARMSARR